MPEDVVPVVVYVFSCIPLLFFFEGVRTLVSGFVSFPNCFSFDVIGEVVFLSWVDVEIFLRIFRELVG